MPDKRKHIFSLRKKLSISAVSFVFFLMLLEISLRIIGHLYLSREITHYGDSRSSDYVILCVGDSFTWGGSVSRDETYAAYLSKLLASGIPHKNFLVINKGKCEYNSSQVLRSLHLWLKEYRPNMVILLVGSSNRFNPWGYVSSASPGFIANLKDFSDDLRVVKMVKLMVANFKARLFFWDKEYIFRNDYSSPVGYDDYIPPLSFRGFVYISNKKQIKSPLAGETLSTAWYYYYTGKTPEAIQLLQEKIKDTPGDLKLLCTLAYGYYSSGNYQKAEEIFQQAQEINPRSEFVRNQKAAFYRVAEKAYQKTGQFDLVLEFLCKTISLDQDNYENYYKLSRAYHLQSKYTADFIVALFQRLLQKNSLLKENAIFMDYLNLFKDMQLHENKIATWLENDLEKIVTLCKEYNADILIQNYPTSYPMANNALKKTASSFHLTFIDNLETFNQFALKNESPMYLFDDSHCTAKGHEVMANNIYATLASKRIITQWKK